jgi:uncharacterized membrane protein
MLNLDYEISKVVHLCELAPLDACMLPFSVKLHYNTQPKLIAAAIYQVYSVYLFFCLNLLIKKKRIAQLINRKPGKNRYNKTTINKNLTCGSYSSWFA